MDYQNMSIAELKAYLKTHQNDKDAFECLMDKLDQKDRKKVYSIEDLNKFGELLEKYLEAIPPEENSENSELTKAIKAANVLATYKHYGIDKWIVRANTVCSIQGILGNTNITDRHRQLFREKETIYTIESFREIPRLPAPYIYNPEEAMRIAVTYSKYIEQGEMSNALELANRIRVLIANAPEDTLIDVIELLETRTALHFENIEAIKKSSKYETETVAVEEIKQKLESEAEAKQIAMKLAINCHKGCKGWYVNKHTTSPIWVHKQIKNSASETKNSAVAQQEYNYFKAGDKITIQSVDSHVRYDLNEARAIVKGLYEDNSTGNN